ncbi:hypothetical protein BV911_13625 [Pseudoruegeria sp. SK021]|nr:hypothetical protein BV911_13625 [Pseudoruegeria sp. SK021]
MRPSMRFVPVKSEEVQATAMVFRVRELMIRQRTQLINADPSAFQIATEPNKEKWPKVGDEAVRRRFEVA